MPTARPANRTDPDTTIPVAEGEDPWTAEELAEIRDELTGEVSRLERAISVAEAGLKDLFSDGSEGAGRDPADVGSSNFERDQEMSLAANAREMLVQSEEALRRIEHGTYGLCDNCREPIGKGRLQAFPRANLCVKCKQREERR